MSPTAIGNYVLTETCADRRIERPQHRVACGAVGNEGNQGHRLDGSSSDWVAPPDAYDLAAEREAAAEAFLAELNDTPVQRPYFERRLTTPIVRKCRYPRLADLRALDRINKHFAKRLRGEPSQLTRDNEITTAEDRQRRARRRIQRAKLLVALKHLDDEFVPFRIAMTLTDAGSRTLCRHVQEGRIAKRRAGNAVLLRVEDLRVYLARKLAA